MVRMSIMARCHWDMPLVYEDGAGYMAVGRQEDKDALTHSVSLDFEMASREVLLALRTIDRDCTVVESAEYTPDDSIVSLDSSRVGVVPLGHIVGSDYVANEAFAAEDSLVHHPFAVVHED